VPQQHDLVFLFDVDNTLLDNDRVEQDLKAHLTEAFGFEQQQRYWAIFESLRAETGYADYLGALQRYRIEHPGDPRLLEVSTYLVNYPFAERLYPGALRAIDHCRERGPVVLLTDGDVVFQPRKVERSGLRAAVGGDVLIYIHKEEMLDDVAARYPARHYVMVDDKLRILTAIHCVWSRRVTTVFVRQGRYALDQKVAAMYPPADVTLESIGELAELDIRLLAARAEQSAPNCTNARR
jgi:FMN phosphatase YigB (HAD superfamily)